MIKRLSFLLVVTWTFACETYDPALPSANCENLPGNNTYSKSEDLVNLMQGITSSGAPGAVLSVYSNEGWWEYASGYSSLEDKTYMQPCHLQYLQSISKTYHAVAVLKLYEEGFVNLDDPINNYLSEEILKYIDDPNGITIRMLLNHTSGIPDYDTSPSYITELLQNPGKKFTYTDYLEKIEGKSLEFQPGTRYAYRNINYVLIALIIDYVTGDHAHYLNETIFKPLNLENTFYRDDANYLEYSNLPNSYLDRFSDGILENVSRLQKNNVSNLIGDDGIVSTPRDAVIFLRGLMEGNILNKETLDEMKQFVLNEEGIPTYGLGLSRIELDGYVGYGHGGSGIGASCYLRYFPESGIYVFASMNLGSVTESPLHEKINSTLDEIIRVLNE